MIRNRKSGCSYLPPGGIVAARALNFRVRYGIGCVRRAIAAADEKRKRTVLEEIRSPETECHSPLSRIDSAFSETACGADNIGTPSLTVR